MILIGRYPTNGCWVYFPVFQGANWEVGLQNELHVLMRDGVFHVSNNHGYGPPTRKWSTIEHGVHTGPTPMGSDPCSESYGI